MMKTSPAKLQTALRRFPKRSSLRKYWQQLTLEEQAKIRSIAWSASIHLLLMAILAMIGFAAPTLESLEIAGGFTGDATVEELATVSEPDLGELIIQEIESVCNESMEVHVPAIAIELDHFDLPLKQEAASDEREEGSAISELSGYSNQVPALSDLTSDESRIAETDRRVAAAGGALNGPVRVSLIFSGDDDIDLHVKYQESGRRSPQMTYNGLGERYIFFGSPQSEHALLDVDANAIEVVPAPCENVIFKSCPRVANYSVAIHHYAQRGRLEPVPYVVVVKYGSMSKVFRGTILPNDGLKLITNFRHSS